jgi:hypothetical protein
VFEETPHVFEEHLSEFLERLCLTASAGHGRAERLYEFFEVLSLFLATLSLFLASRRQEGDPVTEIAPTRMGHRAKPSREPEVRRLRGPPPRTSSPPSHSFSPSLPVPSERRSPIVAGPYPHLAVLPARDEHRYDCVGHRDGDVSVLEEERGEALGARSALTARTAPSQGEPEAARREGAAKAPRQASQ